MAVLSLEIRAPFPSSAKGVCVYTCVCVCVVKAHFLKRRLSLLEYADRKR